MDHLSYFDDPEVLRRYQNSYEDNDFDKYIEAVESGLDDEILDYDDIDIDDDSQWEEVLGDE